MKTVEEYVSPDGLLRFVIVAYGDGELALGFDKYPSHTHADILAVVSGLPEDQAVRQYVDDLLADRSVIAIWAGPGDFRDASILDDPVRFASKTLEGQTVQFRYWSGRAWSPG